MNIKPSLNKVNILTRVDDSDIFKFYCPDFNGKFQSEFRSDSNPSCSIHQLPSGDYIFKDFGEDGSLDCFGYVMRKYNLGFLGALKKINEDMNLGLGWFDYHPSSGSNSKRPNKYKNYDKSKLILSETKIDVNYRDFNNLDADYWTGRYKLPLSLVESHYNFPINWYHVHKGDVDYRVKPKDICYTQNYYIDKTGILRRKIYRPYGEKYKWTSNITTLVVQGIKHLPKHGDLLIITKSMKDLLVMNFLGYDVIASNNETSFIPIAVLDKLKKRFKRIIINYDSDETGIRMGNKIADMFSLETIFTNSSEFKDPSDFIERYGELETKQYFKDMIYGES